MVTFSSSYTPPYPLRKVNIGTFSDWVSGVHQSKLQSSSPSHQAPVAKLQPSSSSRQAPASRQAPVVKLCSHQASVALHQSKLQSPSSRRHHYTLQYTVRIQVSAPFSFIWRTAFQVVFTMIIKKLGMRDKM